MYAETGLLFPCFQNFYPEVQQLEEFYKAQKSTSSLDNVVQVSTISEYDLGGAGDLFKAPEPIIEEPIARLDLMTAAISMISGPEDVISSQGLKSGDIVSLQGEPLLSEVFYECKKDLLAQGAFGASIAEVMDMKVPLMSIDGNQSQENNLPPQVPFPKCVSTGSLSSMGIISGLKPSFLDFAEVDFRDGTVCGMRRAFSEGDIKTLDGGNVGFQSPLQQPILFSNYTSEGRWEKLSRYRNKKSKRNFGRKIKYACRKALADNQPRIRGRFAKMEESDTSKGI
ncbi:two-component response regulator-like PRR37 [Syzygium oleosum]|uniref:two-component response regulator-like PRR37 n=1 Tax=Syzygium oleosum TaxID=219896 RepID=UPI0011D2354D|nr:two-component response regulator-like PRR37 [Syzygium oleosum]